MSVKLFNPFQFEDKRKFNLFFYKLIDRKWIFFFFFAKIKGGGQIALQQITELTKMQMCNSLLSQVKSCLHELSLKLHP